MAKRRRQGTRFRLLIYERMWKRWAWPCVLIIPASFALWWVVPYLGVTQTLYRTLALIPALIAFLLLVFTSMARRLAWVQCRANYLRIQTPFYPLSISYSRFKEVLPNTFYQVFDLRKEKAARRRWLKPYWSQTAIVVRLTRYPVPLWWLRMWFSPYLLLPKVPGFVFLVDDWMGFSRQLDDFRADWETRRAERRQERLARRIR